MVDDSSPSAAVAVRTPHRRPDGAIYLPTLRTWFGDDIVDSSGIWQSAASTASGDVRRRGSSVLRTTARSESQRLVVTGPRRTPGFTVRYFTNGNVDVTAAVTGTGYQTIDSAPATTGT